MNRFCLATAPTNESLFDGLSLFTNRNCKLNYCEADGRDLRKADGSGFCEADGNEQATACSQTPQLQLSYSEASSAARTLYLHLCCFVCVLYLCDVSTFVLLTIHITKLELDIVLCYAFEGVASQLQSSITLHFVLHETGHNNFCFEHQTYLTSEIGLVGPLLGMLVT